MDAHDVIESYVRDVARYLRRDARNDVAFELRALLHDELAAKAAERGREPDRAMAMKVLAPLGRPSQMAARYRPRDPLVEPEDNHNFVIWAIVGIVALLALGRSGDDLMRWIGILFVVFALIGWARRRSPAGRFTWRPHAQDLPARGWRWSALASAVAMAVFPLAMYLSPQAFWEIATFGKGSSTGLALSDAFLGSWQRVATLSCLVLVVGNYLIVAIRNGWRRWNRRIDIASHVALGVMLLMHAAPMTTFIDRRPFSIFAAPEADAIAMPWFGVAAAITLLSALYDMYREWMRIEPAPAAGRHGSTGSAAILSIAVGLAMSMSVVATPASALRTQKVDGFFAKPVFLTAPPGDTRLFVLEQRGRVRIVENGQQLAIPFLDISTRVQFDGTFQGLLGMAFHPDYATNGEFYVNYTFTGGDTRVSRFHVSGNPNRANTQSEEVLLTIDQPNPLHNGGYMAFGPDDGYLYIGMGDGGPESDPDDRAQDPSSLLGKILRIDVGGDFPYTVPPDNPFVGEPGYRPEIWALGLREPWGMTFDRETHDLWIADVGNSRFEEINFQPAGDPGGHNYGWKRMEGMHCFEPPGGCDDGTLTWPIHEYSHSNGCSVNGGYVYRGKGIPGLAGTYFFSDYCTRQIWTSGTTASRSRLSRIAPPSSSRREPARSPSWLGSARTGSASSMSSTGTGTKPSARFTRSFPIRPMSPTSIRSRQT